MTQPSLDDLRAEMRRHYLPDEGEMLAALTAQCALSQSERSAISKVACKLVHTVRQAGDPRMMEAFLSQYGLSTSEGVALMCLAEALLRVPDAETVDELIRDKIAPHDWSRHAGGSGSIFVNASTWALMLTGRVLDDGEGAVESTLRGMVRRLGEPVIRAAVAAAMREMGDQFVLGRTIEEAMRRATGNLRKGYLYSFDMLGEAARTDADALRYHAAYENAIARLSQHAVGDDIRINPGISVKLSALHPRYEATQAGSMLPVMTERVLFLAQQAKRAGMGFNIDAEEADRLDLSLDVIEAVLSHPSLAGWDGFGVVVQAYGPRARFVIDWLYGLAVRLDRKIMVRLVKGAYWDSEIKRAQVTGLSGYPVFTRKTTTDISYIACARRLLRLRDRIYPQFATHNAHTVSAVLALASDRESFEFQRLHGMGEALHEAVRKGEGTRCRIYAPVGAHADLLAYLVRRLLENGANSSFVHQIVDKTVDAKEIARDPIAIAALGPAANPAIAAPARIFCPQRRNSRGWDLTDPMDRMEIERLRSPFSAPYQWTAGPLTRARGTGAIVPVRNPARQGERVGQVTQATEEQVGEAVGIGVRAQPAWARVPVEKRSGILRRAADLYEANAGEFLALATREAGKTLADGIAEIREAVDFLRYYAAEAPAAQKDSVPRGAVVCISPWNFPLAIFTGQIAAALATGNSVLAKPAEQTALIAARAVALLHQAGIPDDVLQLLPGSGDTIGAALTSDRRIAGVCFTGSTAVAKAIERQLAETAEPTAMLVAETGGLNAMIVDSTALPEQAVRDILASAFQSAGQRCSALRILYLQKDVEAKILPMLTGAMAALNVGDPWSIATDVGPVIDEEARAAITGYCRQRTQEGRLVSQVDVPEEGLFVSPSVIRLSGINELETEVFGPVLHIARFEADELDRVLADINARGYGLTFGLHTRIDVRVQQIVEKVRVGNVYVNRNQIGAVVGSQPFGGEGLSGTGPKAGGPHYLRRFRTDHRPADRKGSADPVTGQAVAQAFEHVLRAHRPGRSDRIAVLRKHLRGRGGTALAAAAALERGPVDLPGPTGEANTLSLFARGKVLCLGPDEETLLGQVIQALAAGNAVVAVAPGASAALQPLLGNALPLAALDGRFSPSDEVPLAVDLVACTDHGQCREIRRLLARQEGAIVPLVTDLVHPAAYAVERSVCVDTTAAGGNASLLAAV